MAKNLRRNCDNPQCKKQYRYKKEPSKYCSQACRQVGRRQRQAEKDKTAREAELNGWMAGLRKRQAAAQIEPQIETPARPRPAKPADECDCIGKDFGHLPTCPLNPDPTRQQGRAAVQITIRNVPTRFPGTPLPPRR